MFYVFNSLILGFLVLMVEILCEFNIKIVD